jgi:L-ascorbate metabolism protein UlaG (beta-lactamase superfamily)
MRIRLLRHATLIVELAGRRLLIDPMLGAPESVPPVENTANDRRNPLVALPDPATRAVEGVDAALITHLHSDHLDPTGIELLPNGLPLVGQPEDADTLRGHGFTAFTPVAHGATHDLGDGLAVTATPGRHGRGEIGAAMAPVSGFVLRAPGEPVLYVAGDTIWCEEVARALDEHRPDVVVVNAGAAQFTTGDPITMTGGDALATARHRPTATVVAVHMEAINHCLEDRAATAAATQGRVRIPADGEWLEL